MRTEEERRPTEEDQQSEDKRRKKRTGKMTFKPPEKMDFDNPNWIEWKNAFLMYRKITELDKKDEEMQIITMKYCMGIKCESIIKTMNLTEEEEKSFNTMTTKFDNYFKPKRNEIRLRRAFQNRNQEQGETIESYLRALYSAAEDCKFSDKEERIRDQFIFGLNSDDLIEKLEMLYLTCEKAFTLDIAMEYCRSYLDVKESRKKSNEQDVARIRQKKPKEFKCSYCGLTHEKKKCPAFNKVCNNCGYKNHFSSVCKKGNIQKSQNEVAYEEEQTDNESENNVTFIGQCKNSPSGNKDWSINAEVNGTRSIKFKVDTGADVTVINSATFEKLKDNAKLIKPDRKLRSPGGLIKLKGMFEGQIIYRGKTMKEKVYVLEEGNLTVNLLSRNSSETLGIVKFLGSVAVSEEIFGFGEWKTTPVELKLSKDATPFAIYAPRKIPIPILPQVKNTLEILENLGIIEKVTKPTSWASPMVPVVKSGSKNIRITVDYKHLNRHLSRETFPIPSFEELTAKFTDSAYFSKLDAASGFYQIPISESSRDMTTFITPFGRFRFCRLPMGVNIAPEIFQRKMMELTLDLEGVVCYMDDIVVHGRTQEEHDSRLEKLLSTLKQAGLKLNRNKCSFSQKSITFLGHLITKDGIRIDPEKVAAIRNIQPPRNVQDLRKLLGMINFLTKFIPSAQDLLAPLNELLKSDTNWIWDEHHENSLEQVKDLLSKAPTLAFYDPSKETVLSADASSYGIGGVLLQKHGKNLRPIAYCSRSLTRSERNWAQIEKELLAAVYASEKFNIFLCGLKYTLETDHKPLVPLINSKDLNDAPIRCQRLLMRLARYTPIANYVPGKYLVVADTLSRLLSQEPGKEENELSREVDCYVNSAIAHIPASKCLVERVREAQKSDDLICRAREYTMNGWDSYENDCDAYQKASPELSVSNTDILVFRNRLVIPPKLRREMLQKIHSEGHLNLSKCRERAQASMWWPGISSDLDTYIKSCDFCQENRRKQHSEPLKPTPLPSRPWEKIGLDLFELHGKTYLLAVDYYSRWLEIEELKHLTTNAVLSKLKIMFSRWGIPEEIRSDGGPQFVSSEFTKFCHQHEIFHSKSSPYNSQSNGAAERGVQTAKRLMKTADPVAALMEYRATPLQVTGCSPSQLIMGRRIRTTLPLPKEALDPKWPDAETVRERDKAAKQKNCENYNRAHGARALPDIPKGSYVREKKDGDKKWSEPKLVNEKVTDRSYSIRNRRFLQHCPATAKAFAEKYSSNSGSREIESPSNADQENQPEQLTRNDPTTTRSGRQVKPVQRFGFK